MITFQGVRPYYGDDAFLISCRVQPIPTIENEKVTIPLRPGVISSQKIHRERRIHLSFELLGHNAKRNAEIAQSIALWAETSSDEQFVLDEQPDRFYLAKLDESGEVDYAEEYPVYDLTFVCSNPYAYSIDTYSGNVGGAIAYSGTVAAWPCIRFIPEADVNAPTWSDGARIISFDADYTARAGHEIVIDCANRCAIDNGESIMQHLAITSDWLKLECGDNQIVGSGGIVEWRNVYL